MAVLQKYIDQGISVNTSYNPQHYEDEKIPMSDMLKHMVMFYRFGGKQLYYFNTYDGSGEIDLDKVNQKSVLIESVDISPQSEDDCEACKI